MMQRYEKHENQMKSCATCAHETDSKWLADGRVEAVGLTW